MGTTCMELNPIYNRIQDYQERSDVLRGYL